MGQIPAVFTLTLTLIYNLFSSTYLLHTTKIHFSFLFLPLMGKNTSLFTLTSPTQTNKYDFFLFEMKNVRFNAKGWFPTGERIALEKKLLKKKIAIMCPDFLTLYQVIGVSQ